jgi:hypothetical protein
LLAGNAGGQVFLSGRGANAPMTFFMNVFGASITIDIIPDLL